MREIFPKTKDGVIHRVTDSVFNYNGWPTVTKDDRGVLYAAASSFRLQHVCPAGKNCMYLSFDEGETWTCPIVVNDSYLDDRDTGIVYMGNGKLLMSWFSDKDEEQFARFKNYEWLQAPQKAMILGMGQVPLYLDENDTRPGCFVKISEDYGVTWSENIRVPLNSPHGPNVMNDGTLIYFGKIWGGQCGENENKIAAFHSADDGRTWQLRGIVPVPEGHALWMMHEAHVVQLPSGRLLGAMRVHGRPVEPSFTVYTTFSDDGGYTWSVPECIGVDGSPPHLLVHSSGAVICSYSRRGDDNNKHERACVSYDGGETWTEDYLINDKAMYDHGYPATVELSDGSLLTVYYQPYPGDGPCSILYTKWRLEDK